jgi:hypothetical protein
MSLKKILEDANEEFAQIGEKEKEDDELTSSDIDSVIDEKPQEVAQVFADALAVVLAQVEKMTEKEFKSSEQAFDFVMKMLPVLRSRHRSELLRAFRRFDRMGAHRVVSLYRRTLANL